MKKSTKTDLTDYLSILKRLTINVITNENFIIFNKFVLMFQILLYMVEITYFFKHFSVELIINYGNGLSKKLYGLISLSEIVRYSPFIKNLLNEKSSLLLTNNWSHRKNIEEEINKRSKSVLIFAFAIFLTALVSFISLTPFVQVSREYVLLYVIFDEFLLLSGVCNCVYWLMLLHLSYASNVFGFLMLACVLQFKGRLNLILEEFLEIPNKYRDHDEVVLRNSGTYQKDMYEKIRRLIKNQKEHKETMQNILDMTILTNTLYLIVGFTTLMCGIYSGLHQLSAGNFKYFAVFLPAGQLSLFTSLLYWECGQVIQDESTRIFDAIFKSKWYIWNKKNRQALQLFMIYNTKPQILSVAGMAAIDYNFAVKVMRVACSTAITFYHLGF